MPSPILSLVPSTPGTPNSMAPTVSYDSDLPPASDAEAVDYGDQHEPACPAATERDGPQQAVQPPSAASREEDEEDPPSLEASSSEKEEGDKKVLAAWLSEIESEEGCETAVDLASLGRSIDLMSQARQAGTVDMSLVDAFLASGAPRRERASATGSAVKGQMSRCHGVLGPTWVDGVVLVYTVDAQGSSQAEVGRDSGTLTADEVRQRVAEVTMAKFKEISAQVGLNCFQRMPRKLSRNRVDARSVFTWRAIDGRRVFKAGLTMRGFKGRCALLETFAGTSSRASRRVVNSEAAMHEDWVLFNFGVSQAPAKGMTLEEFARLTRGELREVELKCPPGCAAYPSVAGVGRFQPRGREG